MQDTKNEKIPAHAFLDQQRRRYAVKSLSNGEWRYDMEMIMAAAHRARSNRDDDMERAAERLQRAQADVTRKALDKSWQPVMPLQYVDAFKKEAGRSDEQTLAGTDFFQPIATESGSGVSTTANMRQFRRHMDGQLDWPSAIDAVVGAWSAATRGDFMNPIERALLEVLYPGQMDLMDPFAAEMLISISDEECDKLKEMSESKIKEIAGFRDGTPKMLPGSSFGAVR